MNQSFQISIPTPFVNQEAYPFYQTPKSWTTSIVTHHHRLDRSGTTSPRVNGRLVLRENAYNHVETEYELKPTIYGSNVHAVYHDGWFSLEVDSPYDVKRVCIEKWYKKAADVRMNLAVSLAEAGKTADMLYAMSYRVGGALRALRKGFLFEAFREFKRAQSQFRQTFRRDARRQQDAVSRAREALTRNSYEAHRMAKLRKKGRFQFTAPVIEIPLGIKPGRAYDNWQDLWLEYKYGWLPLLLDVEGAMKSTVDNFTLPSKVIRRTEKDIRANDAWGRQDAGLQTRTVGSLKSSCTIVGTLDMGNDVMHRLQTLGLTNPALVAWELVPFSFVVDWFLPIGDWLEATTALHGLRLKTASMTITKVTEVIATTTLNRSNWSAPYLPVYLIQPGEVRFREKSKVRTLGLPGPNTPEFGFPDTDIVGKSLTSLALARRMFKTNSNAYKAITAS